MRFSKIIITSALLICLSAPSVFAVPEGTNNVNESKCKTEIANDREKSSEEKCRHHRQQDPIKALQNKKEKIQSMQKDGKLTKEEAETKIKAIDNRIKMIQEFNKLPLQQRKELLTKNLKERIDTKVKDGVLTREKADEIIKKLSKEIEKWDGNGYPEFFKKGVKLKNHINGTAN